MAHHRDFDPPSAGLRSLVARALEEDFGLLGDLTSIATIPDDATADAAIVARRYGVKCQITGNGPAASCPPFVGR